jgi:drug/metabolite transporter (DMT)-like permease
LVAYALALGAAVAFGTGDFLGGIASRRASVWLVVLLTQAVGFTVVIPALLLQGSHPTGSALAWGALGGVAGGIGLLMFFRALSQGHMSVTAPVTAVVAAGLPILIGVAIGERPALQAWLGIAAGLAAIVVISRAGHAGADPAGAGRPWGALGLALAAGAGFGIFFVCLSRTPAGSGLWPLVGARSASVTLLALTAVVTRQALRAGPGTLRLALPSGLLDMTANVLFLLAVRQGALGLVVVLVSLYPAVTVALALTLLRERLHAAHMAGIALALAAVVLIAAA